MPDVDIILAPDDGETLSLGDNTRPAKEVVLTGDVRDPSGNGASALEIKGAADHAAATGNPHNTTAANVGAEAANANIQTHVTGTGSPHTAAGVGAEPALGNPSADDYVLSSKMSGTRSWIAPPAGGVTSVSGTAPIASSGGTTPAISISAATTGAAGSMSSADKTKLDGISSGADVTGAAIHAASADTLADAYEFGFWNTVSSALKNITWANLKSSVFSALTTAGDLLYATAAGTVTRLAIGTVGYGLRSGGASTLPVWIEPYTYLFTAGSMDSNGIADGAVSVTVLATTEVDPTNAALTGVMFDPTTAEGKFLGPVKIPGGATGVIISVTWKAISSPGSSKGVVWKLFSRLLSNGSARGAWDAGTALTAQTTSNATDVVASQNITLSTLGWTAGDIRQLQWTRLPTDGSDDLAVDAALIELRLLFY